MIPINQFFEETTIATVCMNVRDMFSSSIVDVVVIHLNRYILCTLPPFSFSPVPIFTIHLTVNIYLILRVLFTSCRCPVIPETIPCWR